MAEQPIVGCPDSGSGVELKTSYFRGAVWENKRLSSFKLLGQLHRFAYMRDGTAERLAAWSPPVGEIVKFLYQPESGLLSTVGTGNTEDPARVERLKTVFVNPKSAGTLAEEFEAKKLMRNYWLTQDTVGTYSYGRSGKDKKQWDAAQVTLTALSGLVQNSNYAENRGIVTTKQGATERKNYYFRSPGQKYDGKLRRIEENGALVQEYRYDRKSGLLTEMVDAKGKSIFYDYDPAFHPSKRVEWEPKPVRIRRGTRTKSETVAEYAYNEEGKLTAEKDGKGNVTRYTYTSRGEIASVTNPAGDTVSYTYDGFGRCNSVSSADRKESVEYDEDGRVRMQVAADGTKTGIVYDQDGQIQNIVRNGKVVKEVIRDEFKRIIGEKDALKRISRTERDIRGNLLAQYSPNDSVTRYQYDSLGHRTAQIDGNGNKITFKYDAADHLIKQINALGNVQTWTYDPKTAKLLERTNGEQVITQSYNKDGRLAALDYGKGERLTITYDDEGRQLSITGPETSVFSTYNEQGRMAANQFIHGEDEQLLSYRYNLRGQRTGLMISKMVSGEASGNAGSGPGHYEVLQQTEQTYDPAGNLSSILTDGMPAISYSRDVLGRPIRKTYGAAKNGMPALTADISYDSTGRLAGTTFQGGALSSPLSLSYEWDDADQLSRRTWNGQMLRYEYDPSGQLLKVIDAGDQSVLEAYTYDPAGNMLTKLLHGQLTAMTYNAANQLTGSYDLGEATPQRQANLPKTAAELGKQAKATLAYSYDAAGRMLGTQGQPPNQYGWLDKVTEASLPGGAKATHHYWPDGQLCAITASVSEQPSPASPSSETFLWDGLALIRRNDTIYITEPHPSGGIPIASHPVGHPEEITYYLNDMLGTTLATVGPQGPRFSKLTSFGQPLKSSSSGSSLGTDAPSSPTNPVPSTNQLPPTKR